MPRSSYIGVPIHDDLGISLPSYKIGGIEALNLGVIYFEYMCESKHMSSEYFTPVISCFGEFCSENVRLTKSSYGVVSSRRIH
jgi:hypothetical protein